jgi:MoaA/NifB/PqqE/SkfB family radical SAM enzyme
VELMTRVRRRLRRYGRRASMAARWVAYRTRLTRPPTFPDRMYLESTNVCNLQCIMCPTGLGQQVRPKGFIDFELFKRIVDEMAPHVSTTTLHIWGEPLLHPRILDMIAYCSAHNLHAEISTNATLLTPEVGRKILQAGLGAIYLCLDGATPETYEKVRRRADYAETRANIEAFLAERQRLGLKKPLVKLQIIEIAPTQNEIAEFRRQWEARGVDKINVKAFDSWGDQLEQVSELRPADTHLASPRYPCPNLWYHVHIYWDGTLVCCDRDFNAAYPLGNVAQGVMKAWRGACMAELRRKHIECRLEDVPSCRSCVEWAWWQPTLFTAQGNAPVKK